MKIWKHEQRGKSFQRSSLFTRILAVIGIFSICIFLSLMWVGQRIFSEIQYQKPPFAQGALSVLSKTLLATEAQILSTFNSWLSFGLTSHYPTIQIDVSQKDRKKLEYGIHSDREIDRDTRRSTSVKATLRFEDKDIPAKIRIKGDRELHWGTDKKWSFRVETKGNKPLFGMTRFSLQKPVVRNYVHEWLFHNLLKKEGLISLRYKFVTLKVNGEDWGVYAIEEHFDKRLIEFNARRNGPILSGDALVSLDKWRTTKSYQKDSWSRTNPDLMSRASMRMEGFKSGELSVDDVFDTELWGRYFAICEILNTWHGALEKSVKFYFNPITQLFEPIGYDGHFLGTNTDLIFSDLGPLPLAPTGVWFQRMFDSDLKNNIQFIKSYIYHLEKLTKDGYMQDFLDSLRDDLNQNIKFINSEIPFTDLWHFTSYGSKRQTNEFAPGILYNFNEKDLYRRAEYLRKRLLAAEAVDLYVVDADGENLSVRARNMQSLPIEIGGLVVDERKFNFDNNIILHGVSSGSFHHWLDYKVGKTDFSFKEMKSGASYKFYYRPLGATAWFEKDLMHIPVQSASKISISLEKSLNSKDFPRFINTEDKNIFKIDAGKWDIHDSIVLPKMSVLKVAGGTTLNLLNGSRIISHGGVELVGSAEKPIKVISEDGSGQGLFVIGNKQSSVLKHVIFQNLTIHDVDEKFVTSPVNFYDSSVEINNVQFRDIVAEDGLNLVRSNFHIENTDFSNILSDGFDSDFSNGDVINVSFNKIGNDGLDFSGSAVRIRNVTFEEIGDKSISVGEASKINVEDVKIRKSKIGIAVKDGSQFTGIAVDFEQTEIPVAVFKKKPEYEFPVAVFKGSSIKKYMLEEGSRLIVDDTEYGYNSDHIRRQLYD